jgi:hypothetical protein
MAAPDFNWNTITATQTDADSVIDEILMEALRQNQIHLEQWLGDGYIAAKDHDHDEVNSKSVVLGSGVVTNDKINKTYSIYTTQSIAALSSWVPSARVMSAVENTGDIRFNIRVSGTWRGGTPPSGTIIMDGSELRFSNIDGIDSNTLYYANLS